MLMCCYVCEFGYLKTFTLYVTDVYSHEGGVYAHAHCCVLKQYRISLEITRLETMYMCTTTPQRMYDPYRPGDAGAHIVSAKGNLSVSAVVKFHICTEFTQLSTCTCE